MSERKKQLLEIGSWRLATEMLRHHPKELRIIETHPGGGLYDCLTIIDKKRSVDPVYINRCGSISGMDVGVDTYRTLMDGSIEDIHKKLFVGLRLEYKTKLPSSTPNALVYRFISAVLSQAAFAKDYWECRNGYDDSSGWGGCVYREEYFEKFPAAFKRADVKMKGDLYNVPYYRFWFIVKGHKPICCLETTGLMWTTQGKHYNLMDLYKKHRRLWPIITETIGDKLD